MSEEALNENPLLDIGPLNSAPVSVPTGIAALAMNFAMKYWDINTVQDGTLYQQYKLEGKNLRSLHLDEVFETAIRIERHLVAAEGRIAEIVSDMAVGLLIDAVDRIEDEEDASGTPTRSAETTGSVGEADGGPAPEGGDAQGDPS